MTKNELAEVTDKVYGTNNPSPFGYRNGVCKECGQDHNHRPAFDNVRTSIDTIPFLIQKLRELEQML